MWVCDNCGKEIHEGFEACWNCGISRNGPAAAEQQTSEDAGEVAPGQTTDGVRTYLTEAILVTIFCCTPFGIVAIVYAAMAKGKLEAGDYAGASELANKAKTWCLVSLILGMVAIAIYVLSLWAENM